ncbi:MAG: GNAT family N-acetyltransferase [Kiritimatiellae bacterium]|nr:GNAT family N-acetyltransferase [Kiritimatiellia bacterium]
MQAEVPDAKGESGPMAGKRGGQVIREMLEDDSWEDLTALLHEAYREHFLAGRDYAACSQSVEETRQRCQGGTTLLAFADGRLEGTATMHERMHFGRPCGYVSQVAVSPGCRGMGTGRKLLESLETIAKEKGVDLLECNTAATARRLVAWYQRQGWQKVSLRSYEATNYYSVVFRKKLDGKRHARTAWHYPVDWMACHLLWRKDGELRLLGKIAWHLGHFRFLRPGHLSRAVTRLP